MAIADVNNLHKLWGVLIIAGLGIGGIVVPASIITTIICPDVCTTPSSLFRHGNSDLNLYLGPHRNHLRPHSFNPCRRWQYRLHRLLQRLHQQVCSQLATLHWRCHGYPTQYHRRYPDRRSD